MGGISLMPAQRDRMAYARSILSWARIGCADWLAMSPTSKNALVDRVYGSRRLSIDHATRALVASSTDEFCQAAMTRPAGVVASTPPAPGTPPPAQKSFYDILSTLLMVGVDAAKTIYNSETETNRIKLRNDFELRLQENNAALTQTNSAQEQANLASQNALITQLLTSMQEPSGLSTGATIGIAVGAAALIGGGIFMLSRRRRNPSVHVRGKRMHLSSRRRR